MNVTEVNTVQNFCLDMKIGEEATKNKIHMRAQTFSFKLSAFGIAFRNNI